MLTPPKVSSADLSIKIIVDLSIAQEAATLASVGADSVKLVSIAVERAAVAVVVLAVVGAVASVVYS